MKLISHSFRIPRTGIERLPPGYTPPRHQHCDAYATVLVSGAYEQCSYAGRMRIRAGSALIQPTLDYHADRMLSSGLTVLRLPWPREESYGGLYADCDVDWLVRLAERDVMEAAAALQEFVAGRSATPPLIEDPADLLVGALREPRIAIADWARDAGRARETVSRGFGRLYGVAPSRFRAELRARAAWLRITGGSDPLAVIANDCGFADQAHMTRAIRQFTGAMPTAWRYQSHSFKTNTSGYSRLAI